MKTVLITGASRGIGLGLAKVYFEKGWTVIACCRAPESFDESRRSFVDDEDRFLVMRMDVVDRESIKSVSNYLMSKKISLDLIVANAGVFNHQAIDDWDAPNFMDTYAVNTVSVAILAREFEFAMKLDGLFCAMSSAMGSMSLNIGFEGDGDAYAMSKAALNMLCARLAKKWEGRIRVVAISPGWVKTDMGGDEATLTVEESVHQLVQALSTISVDNSGLFLSNEGSILTW